MLKIVIETLVVYTVSMSMTVLFVVAVNQGWKLIRERIR
jgi:hypothetical protein